ncbi:hypothetical protein CEK26_000431 [Fusarium fujikuroi]|uniref:Uncharacterized protein n=1 Tax=Fusarium fujikuroi TaxID=5127 RepID=A0A2H3RBE0_FUSFU|nr:uncharacterized protein Y057_5925 [Fusarium fujikuroi]QGI58304.1 hypothetical protein CEK27_000429 [Fusarium fujikuroi]QGI89216.1 hypothetical protein CEK26_000431 [Fusarium fujikuroi]SCN73270.1 uncharacterized protein FFC1_01730 [Fusarium fujikuroi]SCO27619.1 uncharacterized protein FFMR_00499 [Fusarium fujikuroi]
MEYYCKKSWQSGHFIGRVKSHDELIENARKLIQDFQNARSEIGDDFPSLVETAIELEELDKSIALVQREESLRTAAVIREIKGTIRSVHYQSWEAVRVVGKKKKAVEKNRPDAMVPKRYIHSFRPMPKWAIRTRDNLDNAILCAQVGVIGNEKVGFSTRPHEVFEMDGKVKDVLGIHMVLALRMWDDPTCVDGRGISLGDESNSKETRQHGTAVEGEDKETHNPEGNDVYGNVTLDQARAMAGEDGVQGWTEAARLQPRRMKR